MTLGPISVSRSGVSVTLPAQAGVSGTVTAPNEAAAVAIAAALTWLGLTYAWGGGDANGPTKGVHDGGVADSFGDYNKIGFDCSGLCLYAYAQSGVQLDRPSATMLSEAPSTVPYSAAKPGDLLFWGNPVHHVSIYIGQIGSTAYMIEAPESGEFVRVAPVRIGGDFRGVAREPWVGANTMLVDFTKPIAPSALKAAGVTGILRYLAKQHGSTVVTPVTKAEIAGYHAAGIDVGIIYEDSSATWMAGGQPAGVQAGQWVAAQLVNLGLPTSTVVYYCADDPGISAAAVNSCLDGAASVRGRSTTGLYAFGPQLASAKSGGHAAWFWLCGSKSNEAPGYHLYQHNNNTVTIAGVVGDQDDALQTNWGQLGTGESDMQLTDLIGTNSSGQPITVQNVLDLMYNALADSSVAPNGQTLFDAVWEVRDDVKALPVAGVSSGSAVSPSVPVRIVGSAAKMNTQAITNGFTKRNLSAAEAAQPGSLFTVDDATWDYLEANTNNMLTMLSSGQSVTLSDAQVASISADVKASVAQAVASLPAGATPDQIAAATVAKLAVVRYGVVQ